MNRSMKIIGLGAVALSVALTFPVLEAAVIEMPQTEPESPKATEPVLQQPEVEPEAAAPVDAGPRLAVAYIRLEGLDASILGRDGLKALGRMLASLDLDDQGGEADLVVAAITLPSTPLSLTLQIGAHLQARVTLGMLERVADAVTGFHRRRGFILAKAYIPEQRVNDGVVSMFLLPGKLGGLEVSHNLHYRQGPIEGAFDGLYGKAVHAGEIEERLYLLNDLPGLDARAWFEPGGRVGETRVHVNVIGEDRFAGNLRLDNYGSDSTGEVRAYADAYWFNPSGGGDELHLGVLAAFDPTNTTYGAVHYRLPMFHPRHQIRMGGSSNAFESKLETLTLTGESVVFDANWLYHLRRGRRVNQTLHLEYAHIDTDIEQAATAGGGSDPVAGVLDDFDTRVQNIDLIYAFDHLHDAARSLHRGAVQFATVAIAKGQRVGQRDWPVIAELNYAWLKALRLGDSNSRLTLNTTVQYADTALPSTSQLALTGPYRLRGFELNTYNADRGVYLGAEWIFAGISARQARPEQTRAWHLQPMLFADAGYGERSGVGVLLPEQGEPVSTRRSANTYASLVDLGVGLRLSFAERGAANVALAVPVHYRLNEGVRDENNATRHRGLDSLDDRHQIQFELQMRF